MGHIDRITLHARFGTLGTQNVRPAQANSKAPYAVESVIKPSSTPPSIGCSAAAFASQRQPRHIRSQNAKMFVFHARRAAGRCDMEAFQHQQAQEHATHALALGNSRLVAFAGRQIPQPSPRLIRRHPRRCQRPRTSPPVSLWAIGHWNSERNTTPANTGLPVRSASAHAVRAVEGIDANAAKGNGSMRRRCRDKHAALSMPFRPRQSIMACQDGTLTVITNTGNGIRQWSGQTTARGIATCHCQLHNMTNQSTKCSVKTLRLEAGFVWRACRRSGRNVDAAIRARHFISLLR